MALKFTAHCARDHERVDFTDRAEFERHMIGTHKARKPSHGKPAKPYPWKAPKAPADARGLHEVAANYSGRSSGRYPNPYVRGVGYVADEFRDSLVTEFTTTGEGIRPGDTFEHRGTVYALDTDEREGQVYVTLFDDDRNVKRAAWIDRARLVEQIAAKGGTVTLLNRAA